MFSILEILCWFLATTAILAVIIVSSLSGDTSSWVTYNDHGKYCITRTYHENHAFSPDKLYVDNWCK